MAEQAIPDEIQQFLAANISSTEALDALMLLHAHPGQAWTCEALSDAIFSVPQSAMRTLERLETRGLVSSSDRPRTWHFAATDGTAEQVDRLAGIYRANRAGVIKQLFMKC